MKYKIIVPTDLTNAAGQAIKQATIIARKTKSDLMLVHVLTGKSPSQEEAEKMLSGEAKVIRSINGINCEYLVREGNFMEVIPDVVKERDYDLMVIGTHGVQGFKQMILGADIVKMIAKIPIPALIVQEHSPLIENFQKIVLPVSSHKTFGSAVESVLLLSMTFNPEVHLYSVSKAGFAWPDQLLTNIDETARKFENKGVKMIRVREDQNVYSVGYARQTLAYARSVKADAICIMSQPSKDYYYFAQSDKEQMLLNEYRLPILCAGGGE